MIGKFIISELGKLYRFMRGVLCCVLVLMLIWKFYKFVPEGKELLPLILNASGLAGAAAILGIFYNKTKNDVERPKMTAGTEDLSEKTKKELEEAFTKASAREALNNLVEIFKKDTEEKSKSEDKIKFSDYIYSVFDHQEKSFGLQDGELIKAGYERECQEIMNKIELSHHYYRFGMPIGFFNPILTAKYPFEDPAAENIICLDVYLCKDKVKHIGTDIDIKIYGYALIYAYYNTEMLVSCWELFERTPENVERLKAFMQSRKQQEPHG